MAKFNIGSDYYDSKTLITVEKDETTDETSRLKVEDSRGDNIFYINTSRGGFITIDFTDSIYYSRDIYIKTKRGVKDLEQILKLVHLYSE